MGKIKKRAVRQRAAFRKTDVSGAVLKFSFTHFDYSDDELCPPVFVETYTRDLMRRFRALSSWTVEKFQKGYDATIRNHELDWSKTSRPGGFGKLPSEFRDLPGWQFCLEDQTHGRVHGMLGGDIFYVVWLDRDHHLYPSGRHNENNA